MKPNHKIWIMPNRDQIIFIYIIIFAIPLDVNAENTHFTYVNLLSVSVTEDSPKPSQSGALFGKSLFDPC